MSSKNLKNFEFFSGGEKMSNGRGNRSKMGEGGLLVPESGVGGWIWGFEGGVPKRWHKSA
jgi:hypothetical protein